MFAPWFFEPVGPNGAGTASGQRRALQGSRLTLAQQVGRELVQNSGDAEKDPKIPVKINFRITQVNGLSRDNILRTIRMDEAKDRSIPEPPCGPLSVFYIEDYQTLGLGGYERADLAVNERRNHRYSGLCLNFGDAELNASGGGTYGFGKSIAWAISGSYMVFFYSRFKADSFTEGVNSRLIGLALGNKHPFKGKNYTGRAYLGRPEKGNFTGPLTNSEADAAAAILGFTPRSETDTGTSIMIINSKFTDATHLKEVRAAVEKFYWPRIIDGRLKAELSCNGKPLDPPFPEGVEWLKPFVASYRRALDIRSGATPSSSEGRWAGKVEADGRQLGYLALETLPEDLQNNKDDSDVPSDSVALIRTPRMVVKYLGRRTSVDYPFAGVFVAEDGINPILAQSEPPNHDEWSDTVDQPEKNVVGSVLKLIKKLTGDFIVGLAAAEITPTEGCETLDDELSDLVRMLGTGSGTGGETKVKGKKRKPKQPPSGPSGPKVFSFQYLSGPELKIRGIDRFISARLRLYVAGAEHRERGIKKGAKPVFFQLVVNPRIVIDDGSFDGDPLPIAILRSDSQCDSRLSERRIIFQLPEAEYTATIDIETAPLEHDDQVIDLSVTGNLISNKSKGAKP